MSKLWRCYGADCADDPHGRLGFDFVADKAVCPKCGADGSKPHAKDMIVAREVIHFLYADKAGKLLTRGGPRVIACQPDSGKLPKHATAEPVAVSCLACQQTEAYRRLIESPDQVEDGGKALAAIIREGQAV